MAAYEAEAGGRARSAVKQRRTLPDACQPSTTLRTPVDWVQGGSGTPKTLNGCAVPVNLLRGMTGMPRSFERLH
jgi:hypothetical protein